MTISPLLGVTSPYSVVAANSRDAAPATNSSRSVQFATSNSVEANEGRDNDTDDRSAPALGGAPTAAKAESAYAYYTKA